MAEALAKTDKTNKSDSNRNDSEDLRIIKTHMALCAAFKELLNTKRFEDISVSELCDKAMVRRATFYKHFSDKYDFFEFFITDMQKNFLKQSLAEIEAEPGEEFFMAIAGKLLDFLSENHKMVSHILDTSNLLDILGNQLIKNATDKMGSMMDPIPRVLMAFSAFYIGGILQTIRWWLQQKPDISKAELLEIFRVTLGAFDFQKFAEGFAPPAAETAPLSGSEAKAQA